MDEGMRHFAAGNVRQAIYCFETQLRHCHDENNAQAWRMLGKCHAENDQDREAIICLTQAVERDPYATDALLALAVSHVNELNHEKALACCKAWITHNPQYAGMELTDDLYGDAAVTTKAGSGGDISSETNVFDDVQRLLLRALEYDPSNTSAILQTLGVICMCY
jgi:peroxin-5